MNNDPGLIMAREQIKVDQLNVRLAENSLLPDLRVAGTYDVNSIGSQIDGGPDTEQRLRQPGVATTSTTGRWPCG